jgi:O-antigen/teichoic acid export membrane protein
MDMAYKDLAKDAAIIGMTQVMVNLGNFLLLPIITKTLGTVDYGLWIQVLVTISLLSSVATLGQGSTLLRFLRAKDQKRNMGREYFTVLYIMTLAGIAIVIAMVALSAPLSEFVFSSQEYAVLVVAAAMIVPFNTFVGANNAYFRATGQIKTYATVNIFNAFGEAALILVFVVGGFGILGAVIGSLMADLFSFFIGLAIITRQIGVARPDHGLIRRNMKFGLPLVPNNITQWMVSFSDRYLVTIILGLGMAGVYSAAYGISNVIFLLVAPIQMILYPALARFYDEGRLDKVKEYTKRSFRHYIMLTLPAVVGISMISTPLIIAMTTPDFAEGAMVIPFIAIAGLFSGMFRFVENIPHLVKKTYLNLITFGVPAVADIALVIVLTPLLGIVGTAMATAISYVLMLAIGILISRQFIKLSVDWVAMAKSLGASIIMALVIFFLDPEGMFEIVAVIVVGIVAYFVALYLMKGFDRMEIDIIRHYLRIDRLKADIDRLTPPGRRE